MKTLTNKQFTGKRARVGGFCVDDRDKLHIFAGYCENCNGKIAMTRDDVRLLTRRYTSERKSIKTRVLLRLLDEHRYPV